MSDRTRSTSRPADALPPLGGRASGARATIDLSADREQWAGDGEDRALVSFVLASLMVAEERITTKFSGLVGADGSEEEATFLATQQVDEARHMQFYARFQDEVVAEPGADRRARRSAPASRSRPPSGTIFDERARRGPRAPRRQPRRSSPPRSASSRSTT